MFATAQNRHNHCSQCYHHYRHQQPRQVESRDSSFGHVELRDEFFPQHLQYRTRFVIDITRKFLLEQAPTLFCIYFGFTRPPRGHVQEKYLKAHGVSYCASDWEARSRVRAKPSRRIRISM